MLRPGLRDARDRTARRWRQWRTVAFAGVMGGDHRALIIVAHQRVDRQNVADVLRKRWPSTVLKDLAHAYRTLVWDICVERVSQQANREASNVQHIAGALPNAEVCRSGQH